MKESVKTAGFAAAALVLAAGAALVQPGNIAPAIFSDQGAAFYPKFTDPQAARSIEVVDYDEGTATAMPLKVKLEKGRWVISSHHNYPVDASERLAKTAAALMDVRKDAVRSDSPLDHAKFGVIDPLDTKVGSLAGRGKRVTLRDARGDVLADFILGKPVEGKPGMRYVRVPGAKRTYAVKTAADASARFADWVNAGLLRISAASIRRITVNHYSIDALGGAGGMETTMLTHQGGTWKGGAGEAVQTAAINGLTSALDNLRIIDVRPKPPALAADLRAGQLRVSLDTAMSLRQRGFYLSQNGRLFASQGDLSVETDKGLVYTLRFGEVVSTGGQPGEDRYLFATASARGPEGEAAANALNARFADWYYVISGKDFRAMQLRRKDLLAGGARE
ncbi:MAG: DUF4340 domain-containing protein [Bryobacteraceae bacterium]